MCTGVEPVVLASIIGGGTAAASTVYQAKHQPKPPKVAQSQPEKAPDVSALRTRARRGLNNPYGVTTPSLLQSPTVGRSTLLGQ